jgi:UDP-N-acetylmuramate--alanine ligase
MLVILNIDSDHLEYYETMDGLRQAFLSVLNKLPFYGMAVVNNDDANVRQIIEKANKRVITYGLETPSDYEARNLEFREWTCAFDVVRHGETLGRMRLNLPGKHNVSNSLAAIAVACELEMPFAEIAAALGRFVNAERRFQFKGSVAGVTVFDDYAHHPAEIAATLQAARQNCGGRLIAVFQPHLYSRTLALYEDFAKALALADQVVLAPIYPAREKPIPGVSTQLIADSLAKLQFPAVVNHEELASLPRRLLELVQPGDFVIFLGAGSIWQSAEELLAVMKREEVRFA